MLEHKQVIVLRKDLNMRKGKMIAQGAHASLRAILALGRREADHWVIPLDERLAPWLLGRFKKVWCNPSNGPNCIPLFGMPGALCCRLQTQEKVHAHRESLAGGAECVVVDMRGNG